MRWAFVAAIALVGLAPAACGGSGSASFPDEAECPAPAPLPTSRATPGAISPNSYVSRLQSFATNLEKLRADLKRKYPDNTFHRRDAFRPDFATYASQTVCTAQAMFDLDPPDARFAEYDSTLDALLTDLIDHTRAGREAVRARNVSDYRDWYRDADKKIQAVRNAAYAQAR